MIPASERQALKQIEEIVGERAKEVDSVLKDSIYVRQGFYYEVEEDHIIKLSLYNTKKTIHENLKILYSFPYLAHLILINQNLKDTSPIQIYIQLTKLDLGSNQIQDITPIQNLNNLTDLTLTDNQIKDITPIQNLKNLSTLALNNNQIQDIKPIKSLINLSKLFLSSNQIQDITPIQNLNNLTHLRLDSNQIQDIKPVQSLINLSILVLYNNQIQEISRGLFEPPLSLEPISIIDMLDGKSGLVFRDNPLKSPPLEILKKGRKAVLDYFESLEKGSKPLNEVKIILVGDGAAGKTSLSKVLRGKDFNAKEPQTHGINIDEWSINIGKEKVNTYIWDFGGQEIMHATHQFFLSNRSIYILVLDSRRDEAPEYWLDHIKNFSESSPVIVVLNKQDQNPSYQLDKKQLLRKYPNIKGFIKYSCANEGKRDNLFALIKEEVKNSEIRNTPFSEKWFKVKEELRDVNEDYLPQTKYIDLCAKYGVPASEQDTLLGFLDSLGIALSFTHNNTLVFNPEWITSAVYRIINSALVAKKAGILYKKDLNEVLTHAVQDDFTYPKDQYDFITGLIEEFKMGFKRDAESWIIPALLPVDEPDLDFNQQEHYESAIKVYYEYDFLPKAIFPRLLIEFQEEVVKGFLWRNGAVIRSEGNHEQALIYIDHSLKRIDLMVKGQEPRIFLTEIRKAIKGIHKNFSELEVTEWVPVKKFDTQVEYWVLLDHLKNGKETIYIPGHKEEANVKELLEGIEKAEYSKDGMVTGEKPRESEKGFRPLEKKEKQWWKPIWKVVVGIGVIIAIIVGLVTLNDRFFMQKQVKPATKAPVEDVQPNNPKDSV